MYPPCFLGAGRCLISVADLGIDLVPVAAVVADGGGDPAGADQVWTKGQIDS
ncbi:MAG TPA: hypothetical protein VF933_07915 [Streptosporangiaceae bacterium]